jgi:hypothetical protein
MSGGIMARKNDGIREAAFEPSKLPREIFARIGNAGTTDEFVEAATSADEFDTEGVCGKYKLVETGEITIENAFTNSKPVVE